MPVHHDKDGWWWGSKGPFPSKDKALSVARAAHASGYKEEIVMDNQVRSFALNLLHGVTNAHILHLRADTTAVHLAMGEFYSTLEELTDSFIEAYQGKYEKIMDYGDAYAPPTLSPVEYMIAFLEDVEDKRQSLPQDTYLQNIVDEITQAITSTLNKLRYYK